MFVDHLFYILYNLCNQVNSSLYILHILKFKKFNIAAFNCWAKAYKLNRKWSKCKIKNKTSKKLNLFNYFNILMANIQSINFNIKVYLKKKKKKIS